MAPLGPRPLRSRIISIRGIVGGFKSAFVGDKTNSRNMEEASHPEKVRGGSIWRQFSDSGN